MKRTTNLLEAMFPGSERAFAELQRDKQTVYEVVDAHNGVILQRTFDREEAIADIQTMIDRDGCEPGEYYVRPRRCSLAPV